MKSAQTFDLQNNKPQLPPPIFIKLNLNYKHFCNVIKKLIDPDNFIYKSHIKNLKLQTKTSGPTEK